MSNGAILHIEGKNNPNVNKILHYADGTVEVRTPDWKQVLEVYNIGREATMLDMEDQFLKIYEEATPKDKAKKLRQTAKELAKDAGDIVQIAAIEAEEQEAAEIAAKAARAAKARKKKASEKRSATLFKDETEPTGKENSENETLSSSSADLEESIGSRSSAGHYKEEEDVETSISFEADSIDSDEDEEVEAYVSTEDDEISDSSDADSDNSDDDEELSA